MVTGSALFRSVYRVDRRGKMIIDFDHLSYRLTDKNHVLNIARAIREDSLLYLPPEDIKDLFSIFYLSCVEDNVDAIFKHAELPIERMFLSSILISAMKKYIFFVKIMEPLHSATEKLEIARRNYQQALELWKIFQSVTGSKSLLDFLKYINSGVEIPGFEPWILRQINNSIKMKVYDYFKTFFISMSCEFSEITFNGAPFIANIFIWNIYDSRFKLIIDIDDINHRTDKYSFSNDRSRDRYLQSKGFQVLRFASHEIVDNPLGKAMELINYLDSQR